MKKIFLFLLALCVGFVLTVCASAAKPGDYKYYDADGDGTVDVLDVISILKDILLLF